MYSIQTNSPPSFQHQRAVRERKPNFPEPKSGGARYQIRCRVHNDDLKEK